jgi:hypothetical protein
MKDYSEQQRREILKRAKAMLAGREAKEIDFEIWRATHQNEILDAEIAARQWQARKEEREALEAPMLYTPYAMKLQQQQEQQRRQQEGLSGKIIRREAPIIYKSSGHSADGRDFIITAGVLDEYNDVVVPEGLDFKHFKSKNPIALAFHRHDFVIGTWDEIRLEGNAVRARLVLAKKGTSERIDEIRSLVDQRVLKSCSIGFVSLEQQPLPNGGIKYTRSKLLECSVVSQSSSACSGLKICTATKTRLLKKHSRFCLKRTRMATSRQALRLVCEGSPIDWTLINNCRRRLFIE